MNLLSYEDVKVDKRDEEGEGRRKSSREGRGLREGVIKKVYFSNGSSKESFLSLNKKKGGRDASRVGGRKERTLMGGTND